jgi:hypothetical protein
MRSRIIAIDFYAKKGQKAARNNFKITLNVNNMTGVTYFYGIETFSWLTDGETIM